MIWQEVPSENPADADAFLRHWAPDLGIWSFGALRPGLLSLVQQMNIPMTLVDAAEDGFEEGRWKWLPDLSRATLRQFTSILAVSANAAKILRKLGASDEQLSISGPLQDGTVALPCNEPDREKMMTHLAGRPVWLAAHVQADELDIVLTAHRAAQRGAHRLLLILLPADPDSLEDVAVELAGRNLTCANWTMGDWPGDHTQVLLATAKEDLGLWHRVSPISFMASSLLPGYGGIDPYPAAALGSAVLYGAHIGRYLSAYSRLARAGAARIVRDQDTLAAAVTRLTAPDQAAAMALSAWELLSEGAEVTDTLVDTLLDQLDRAEVA